MRKASEQLLGLGEREPTVPELRQRFLKLRRNPPAARAADFSRSPALGNLF
jgi:hypothetical protein